MVVINITLGHTAHIHHDQLSQNFKILISLNMRGVNLKHFGKTTKFIVVDLGRDERDEKIILKWSLKK
jgi:hypothetical protein